jgi:hypothetical protein
LRVLQKRKLENSRLRLRAETSTLAAQIWKTVGQRLKTARVDSRNYRANSDIPVLKKTFEVPREFSTIGGKSSAGEFLANELRKPGRTAFTCPTTGHAKISGWLQNQLAARLILARLHNTRGTTQSSSNPVSASDLSKLDFVISGLPRYGPRSGQTNSGMRHQPTSQRAG